MFVKAYNEMIRNKEEVLTNLEKVLGEITSEESINADIAKDKEKIEKIAGEVEKLIYSIWIGKAITNGK